MSALGECECRRRLLVSLHSATHWGHRATGPPCPNPDSYSLPTLRPRDSACFSRSANQILCCVCKVSCVALRLQSNRLLRNGYRLLRCAFIQSNRSLLKVSCVCVCVAALCIQSDRLLLKRSRVCSALPPIKSFVFGKGLVCCAVPLNKSFVKK